MDSNLLLHAQFPTSESLWALQDFLAVWTHSQLRDPRSQVLVARDPSSGEIVSFVKWDLPVLPEAPSVESEEINWPTGSCRVYLDAYTHLAEEAKKKVTRDKPCYRECTRLSQNAEAFLVVFKFLPGAGPYYSRTAEVEENSRSDGAGRAKLRYTSPALQDRH